MDAEWLPLGLMYGDGWKWGVETSFYKQSYGYQTVVGTSFVKICKIIVFDRF